MPTRRRPAAFSYLVVAVSVTALLGFTKSRAPEQVPDYPHVWLMHPSKSADVGENDPQAVESLSETIISRLPEPIADTGYASVNQSELDHDDVVDASTWFTHPDLARGWLARDGFTAGYQRWWERTNGDLAWVTAHAFESESGATDWRDRVLLGAGYWDADRISIADIPDTTLFLIPFRDSVYDGIAYDGVAVMQRGRVVVTLAPLTAGALSPTDRATLACVQAVIAVRKHDPDEARRRLEHAERMDPRCFLLDYTRDEVAVLTG